jgi:hypothetical protein
VRKEKVRLAPDFSFVLSISGGNLPNATDPTAVGASE